MIDLEGTEISPNVTIEQLLNHTSGIHDDAEEEAGEQYSQLFVASPNYAIKECKDFLKNFAYKKPNFEPGSDVRYCNCSYVLLGLAIEKITGKGYREYVTENVFRKAGMKNTAFLSMDSINENTAEGYLNLYNEDGEVVGYKKNIYCFPPMGTPDGGAYTTAEDMNLFLAAIQRRSCWTIRMQNCFLLLTAHIRGKRNGGGSPDYMKETVMHLSFFSCRIKKSLSVFIKTGKMTVLPPDLTIIRKKI